MKEEELKSDGLRVNVFWQKNGWMDKKPIYKKHNFKKLEAEILVYTSGNPSNNDLPQPEIQGSYIRVFNVGL